MSVQIVQLANSTYMAYSPDNPGYNAYGKTHNEALMNYNAKRKKSLTHIEMRSEKFLEYSKPVRCLESEKSQLSIENSTQSLFKNNDGSLFVEGIC